MVRSKIIMIIVIIGLFIGLGLTTKEVYKIKHKNEILISNLNELNTKNSELIFDTKQLNNYIKAKDTKHKIEVDSILKLLKIKPKNLIRYEKIESQIKYDAILVDFKDTLLKVDSMYEKTFSIEKKCVSVTGRVFSKDINTKLEIDSIDVKNNIYITESYRRNFWDYILFRKGKIYKKVISDCGQVNSNEINIIE